MLSGKCLTTIEDWSFESADDWFSLYWSTPIGPLQFNWAYPQDYISGVDKLERFSLNLSTMF